MHYPVMTEKFGIKQLEVFGGQIKTVNAYNSIICFSQIDHFLRLGSSSEEEIIKTCRAAKKF